MDAYVYGVLRSPAEAPESAEGVDGQQVELVEGDEVSALVSDAPSLPIKASRRNLTAHSRVLQEVITERCVLPMRFGVVLPARSAVTEELLEASGARLAAELDAFEPYVELDLRVVCPEDVLLRAAVAEHPEIRRAQAALKDRPSDATYYDRIRLGERIAGAVAASRDLVVQRVLGVLGPLASASEVSDRLHEGMVASISFLVERAAMARFDEAVDRLAQKLGPEMIVRYIGPLPPHAFVDLGTEFGARTWA